MVRPDDTIEVPQQTKLTPQQRYNQNHRERRREQWRRCAGKKRAADPASARRKATEWRRKNPDKIAEYNRRDHEKHGPKRAEYFADYYLKNRDHRLIVGKEYNKKNRDKRRAYEQQYYLGHTEKFIEKEERRRARQANAPICDLTREEWEFIKNVYNYRCVYCTKRLTRLTKDHITPLDRGGSHTASNIVPACRSCNAKKGTKQAPRMIQPILPLKI